MLRLHLLATKTRSGNRPVVLIMSCLARHAIGLPGSLGGSVAACRITATCTSGALSNPNP